MNELDEYFETLNKGLCPNCKVPIKEEGETWDCFKCGGHGHITFERMKVVDPKAHAYWLNRFEEDKKWFDQRQLLDTILVLNKEK